VEAEAAPGAPQQPVDVPKWNPAAHQPPADWAAEEEDWPEAFAAFFRQERGPAGMPPSVVDAFFQTEELVSGLGAASALVLAITIGGGGRVAKPPREERRSRPV
jgi:hypothetical protein